MIPAASKADRGQAVLVVVDIQERLASVMRRREKVISKTRLLVRAAAVMGLPVVVTRQYPKGLGDLEAGILAALEQARSATLVTSPVDKTTFDCFAEPSFTEAVCSTGRKQLLIAGMESHICVAQTVLSGLAEGFDVHVVADACCSREEECHGLALARLATAGAVVTTAESVTYELLERAGTDEFRAVLSAVKDAS